MGYGSRDSVREIDTICMGTMSDQISKHFKMIFELRLSKVRNLVGSLPFNISSMTVAYPLETWQAQAPQDGKETFQIP